MSLLEHLARRWRRRWTALAVFVAVASGLLVAVIARPLLHAGAPIPGVVVALAIGAVLFRRRARVDAWAIARHLNRVVPALQESVELLIGPEATLAPLQRLQRQRVERALQALVPPPRLPRRALALGVVYAMTVLLVTAGLLRDGITGGGAVVPGAPPATGASPSPAPPPPRVVDVTIQVRPPAYTGRPGRRTGAWDLDAEEGAHITWHVRTDRAVDAAWLVSGDDDSLRLQPRGPREYEVTAIPERSRLYQLVLRVGATVVTSDYHRLGIIADEPPTLTIVRPEPRTRIAGGEPRPVPLEVVAGDDYGVADAHIVATVTAGSGEAVKFRGLTLDFDSRTPQHGDRTVLLRRVLDLAALRMEPGDELYFSIEAHDQRSPRPNTGRSDTYSITLADTAHVVVAELSGLAVNAGPESLRSQRQIIIDTERLTADAARITVPAFRDRSEGIGFDQHALRDRYGELVGDETVTAGSEPAIEHQHDIEENATLLAQSVKDKLRAALAQMWEAELRLRTYDPRGALPYEYRALDLLKAAQQATRVYVQRTGFEPPPLEPDRKRLTGMFTGIESATRERIDTARTTLPAVRDGLTVVERLLAGERPRAADAATLERAGREIARLAIAEPGRGASQLETLRALRVLIQSLDHLHRDLCRACALSVAGGLWQALPPPDPASAAPRATGSLARTYFERLRSRGAP